MFCPHYCNSYPTPWVEIAPYFGRAETSKFRWCLISLKIQALHVPLLAVDEVEQVQRQRIASLISHMFQQTYANMVNEVIQQEKLKRCYGCTIQHPNQRQHSCFMMDKDDSWLYYEKTFWKN